MEREEAALAEAAALLTVDDFRYLQEHGVIPEHPSEAGTSSGRASAARETRRTKRKHKRRLIKHRWPEVGTILGADYHGARYEAEVVAAPRYKSGKAVRILTGPAAGQLSRSLSGAMLKATEAQRQQQGLARKGVANGWGFWTVKEVADD